MNRRITFILAMLLALACGLFAVDRAVAGPFAIASGGGGGSTAGSDTQVIYNSSGSYAGSAGLTYDGTSKALTLGGATVTASTPVLNLSQTWNNSGVTFTGAKLNVTNTASGSSSLLMDLQVGSTSAFKVDKQGVAYVGDGTSGQPATFMQAVRGTILLGYGNGGGFIAGANSSFNGNWFHVSGARNQVSVPSGSGYGWQSGTSNADAVNDTGFHRNAAKVIEVNSGTAGAYTGTALVLGPQTVAQLPTCGTTTKGARATVTDATSTTFMGSLTGSGSSVVPVFCNGTAWLIG